MINKKCVVCNKEFETKNPLKKYCSDKCKHKIYDKRYYEKNKNKINARCKEYHKEYSKKNKEKIKQKHKKWYQENKDRLGKRQKERYSKNKKDFLLKYKIGKSCAFCSYNEHPEILEFHHKGEKKKSFTLGNIPLLQKTSPKNSKKIKEEIDKCILLCPNCHFLLHFKEHKKG